MFMKLDWGNVLKFADEREYYEVLGFLAKDEEYIRVYTESWIVNTFSDKFF